MKGSSITKTSLGTDYGTVAAAPARLVSYRCGRGHEFELRFAAEADEVPHLWECWCTEPAATGVQDAITGTTAVRHRKTPYEMLRERRSEAELEVLLQERLQVLRERTNQVA